jgi:hypothetical protein
VNSIPIHEPPSGNDLVDHIASVPISPISGESRSDGAESLIPLMFSTTAAITANIAPM